MRTKPTVDKSSHLRVIATVKAEVRFGPGGISILRLGGLSVGKQPAWFRRIVKRDYSGRFEANWFDHFASAGGSLVVEPYSLSGDSLRDILAFADRHGLDIYISATGQHYPTRTITVILTPRKGESAL